MVSLFDHLLESMTNLYCNRFTLLVYAQFPTRGVHDCSLNGIGIRTSALIWFTENLSLRKFNELSQLLAQSKEEIGAYFNKF